MDPKQRQDSLNRRLLPIVILAACLPAAGQDVPTPAAFGARGDVIRMQADARLEAILRRLEAEHPAALEGRETAAALLGRLERAGFGATGGGGTALEAIDFDRGELQGLESEIERLEALAALLASAPGTIETGAGAVGGAVRGRLTGPHGEPVAGAQVVAYDESGRFAGLALSDEEGHYLLVPTDSSPVSLRVRANGLLDVATGSARCETACLRAGRELFLVKQAVVSRDFGLATGLSVSGTVTESGSGSPLGSVYVSALDGLSQSLGWAFTDAAGHYEITGLGPGEVFVRTGSGAPYIDEVYDNQPCLGGSCYAPSEGQPIPLADGQPAPVIDFALDLGGQIGGVVTDEANGDPIAEVRMFLLDPDGNLLAAYDTTDASGSYLSATLPEGAYYVRAYTPRLPYVSEVYPNLRCPTYVYACDLANATPVAVVAATTTTANLDLAIGASISGTVLAEDTMDPVAGEVRLYDETGAYQTGSRIASDGTYAFLGLLDGTFQLHTLNTGGIFFDELYDDVQYRFSAPVTGGTPVVTTFGNETRGIDFALRRGGAIEGTLTAATGSAPLTFKSLVVWDGTSYLSTSSHSSGDFRFSPLEPGTYRIRTQVTGGTYLNEIYDNIPCSPGSCDIETGTPIVVTGTETVTGIDIALGRASTLRGRVTAAATGLPVEGAWISVAEGGAFGVRTAADGTYEIHISDGLYHLRARHDDYVGQAYGGGYCAYLSCPADLGTPVVAPAESEVTGLDFALASGGVVSGTLTSVADGSPLVDGVFWLYDETGLPVEGAVSESDGGYRIPPVPLGGTYYLNLWIPPSGFFGELWRNLPSLFHPTIEPYAPVLEGQAIRFDAGPAIIIDMDLDNADTAKTLTVTVMAGEEGASGTVTTNVGPVDCGSVCSYAYYQTDSVVTLTATPDGGSVFAGWSGDPDCENGEIVMTADRSCTATFVLAPREPPLFADGFESGDLSSWTESAP